MKNWPVMVCLLITAGAFGISAWVIHRDLKGLRISMIYALDAANAARNACQTK